MFTEVQFAPGLAADIDVDQSTHCAVIAVLPRIDLIWIMAIATGSGDG
jgi:hypothetical protein